MNATSARASTGVSGLDDILNGGLLANRLYLVEGMPGSGKRTLAFQFLLEGVKRGEPVLYVTLSETEEEIKAVADSHGWNLDGVSIRELVPSAESLAPSEQYTVFHPSEIELSDTTKRILTDALYSSRARCAGALAQHEGQQREQQHRQHACADQRCGIVATHAAGGHPDVGDGHHQRQRGGDI